VHALRKSSPHQRHQSPVDPSTYSMERAAIIIIGSNRYNNGPDNSTSQNLSADGVSGSTSVTVPNGSGFKVGEFVLLDERSGASWQPTPLNFPGYGNTNPRPRQGMEGRQIAWNIIFRATVSRRQRRLEPQALYERRPACFRMPCRGSRALTGLRMRSSQVASISGKLLRSSTAHHRLSHEPPS